jgi:hypothetical protein
MLDIVERAGGKPIVVEAAWEKPSSLTPSKLRSIPAKPAPLQSFTRRPLLECCRISRDLRR